MVEVGRDFLRSSHSSPLFKQGHLESIAHDHVQMVLDISKETSDLKAPVWSPIKTRITTVKKETDAPVNFWNDFTDIYRLL